MEIVTIVLSAGITIFSIGLCLLSLLSYRRFSNAKLLFVSIAFFIFFIKGLLYSIGIFNEDIAALSATTYSRVLDLIILLFLFIATLKR